MNASSTNDPDDGFESIQAWDWPSMTADDGHIALDDVDEVVASGWRSALTLQRLSFRSRGRTLTADLCCQSHASGHPLPTVILIEDSGTGIDAPWRYLGTLCRLAEAGFLGIRIHVARVEPEESEDSTGGDLGQLLSVIRSLGVADTERLYLYGESRGARVTYHAIRTNTYVRAAAVFGKLTDLQEIADEHPEIRFLQKIPPGQTAETVSHARHESERFWTPILLMYSQAPTGVSYQQTLTLAHRRQIGRHLVFNDPFVEADGPRLVSKAERDQLAIAWFR